MDPCRRITRIGLGLAYLTGVLFLTNCTNLVQSAVGVMMSTEKLTEYRRSFEPHLPDTPYLMENCTFKGTREIASREYLQYDAKDLAYWDRGTRQISYCLPKQDKGFALVYTTEKTKISDLDQSGILAGLIFCYIDQPEIPKRILDDVKDRKDPEYQSVLCVRATLSGKDTRITLLTRDGSEWIESGPYLVEQPIHEENPWWIKAWTKVSAVGYVITVPMKPVMVVAFAPYGLFLVVTGNIP